MILVEIGNIHRFTKPCQLLAFDSLKMSVCINSFKKRFYGNFIKITIFSYTIIV